MSLKSGKRERERERESGEEIEKLNQVFFSVLFCLLFGNEMKVKKCVMTTKGTIDFQCVSP